MEESKKNVAAETAQNEKVRRGYTKPEFRITLFSGAGVLLGSLDDPNIDDPYGIWLS